MTIETRANPQPSWLLCGDCNSEVIEQWTDDRAYLTIIVRHSDTCPAWSSPDPEVAIIIGPGQQS